MVVILRDHTHSVALFTESLWPNPCIYGKMGDLWDDDDGQSWDFVADIDELVERHNKEQFRVCSELLLTAKQIPISESTPCIEVQGKVLSKILSGCHPHRNEQK